MFLRHLLAILALPFVVVVIVPRAILVQAAEYESAIQHSAALGAALILAGFLLWAWCVWLFGRVGGGTLAPWDPTRRLVAAGPYRYGRNPMITGVLTMLVGEALFFGSMLLLAWAVAFWLINQIYFLASEEPGLRRRFGEDYRRYATQVPRWLPQEWVLLLAIVAGVVVMHGVPAVRDYLQTRWAIVGLGGAVFLSLLLLMDRAVLQLHPLARFHLMLLVAYLVHQFEEHGVDLLGRVAFFQSYAAALIADIGAASGFSLAPLAIYRTNTLFVWLPFLAALWGHQRLIWAGLAAAGLVLTNALLHIGIALWKWEYNPGLGTSIALFLPLAMLYFRFVRRQCGVGWRGVAGGVLFGAAEHGLLLLRIRYNLGGEMRPVLLGVIALSPLIANAIHNRLRKAG